MLKIPEIDPRRNSFAAPLYPGKPGPAPVSHTLPLSRRKFDAAIRLDLPAAAPAAGKEAEEEDLDLILDHALVKEAVTALHVDDDRFREELLACPPARIGDLAGDYAKFNADQRRKYAGVLKSPRRRQLFEAAAAAFFAQAGRRGQALRGERIRRFQIEAITRQNSEFAARALRRENILDNGLQSLYRDMIMHNLEVLLRDAPAEERQAALDAAGKDLYAKIMAKRLEVDPAALEPLLAAPAVRRVFSREELSCYRRAVAAALAEKKLGKIALAWVKEGVTPGAAAARADKCCSDAGERKRLLELHRRAAYQAGRKKYLQTFLDLDHAWRRIKEADYDFAAIPPWVKNGDPEFYAFVREMLQAWEAAGGLADQYRRLALCDFVRDFSPAATAERLAERKNLYDLLRRLGGPESPAFSAALRLLLGKTTPADRNWFASLQYARDKYLAYAGAGKETEQTNNAVDMDKLEAFLGRLDQARRIKLEGNKVEELDPLELDALVMQCLNLYF